MTQDEINGLLAAALDEAESRLEIQEACIEMLVEQIERMSDRMDEMVDEVSSARRHYADQRKRLGLTVDLSGGSRM